MHTYHGHVLEGYFSPLMTRLFVTLERMLARVSDVIVAISPAIERELRDGFRIGRAAQYRWCRSASTSARLPRSMTMREPRAHASRGRRPNAEVVTTVGRLTAIKQHRLFLDAVAAASRTRPRLLALVAGDGELRDELEAYARDAGD